MNYGRFFALDMEASRLEDGIAVFNYTWLRDEKANIGDVKISPEYPIFVSITPSFVRFIIQYCTYKQPSNNISPFSFAPHQDSKTHIIHMESMLLELPLTSSSGPGLAATIKRIYNTPFPINLGDNENYIQYLLERSSNSNGNNSIASNLLKVDGIDYSSLSIWNMIDEDEKNEGKNDKGKYYKLYETKEDNKKERYYNKFLRKLFLDFLFDVIHSDVFHNSAHYNQMYGALMSDFFCSSIIKKAEFYYQRALVNDIYKNEKFTEPFKAYDVIYAEALDLAERNWLDCIQSPLADKHFVFTPNWYESKHSYDNDPDKRSNYTWFADPEEELRGVFNGEKCAIDTQSILSSKDLFKKSEDGKDKKKQIENIIVFIIILIVTVLIINNMWSGEDTESKEDVVDPTKVLAKTDSSQQDNLEDNLEDILASINGVGKVKVLIKYSESSTVVAMYNETISESTTKENDGDGGTKDVKETENKKEIVYSDEDGTNKPITEKVVMPIIEGAIVTAQGAGNANVKASIVSAVEAVTGLAVHKIQVFEMGSK